MNISKSLQTEFVAAAHLEEGQYLEDGLKWNKGSLRGSEWELRDQ